jgi:Fe-Mn family superoxide dismutase
MEIHHGKHHQAYINNANKVFESHPDLGNMPVEELLKDLTKIPEAVRTALRNNAGGHANHALFWTVIGPNCGGAADWRTRCTAINAAFGSFDAFKEKFAAPLRPPASAAAGPGCRSPRITVWS